MKFSISACFLVLTFLLTGCIPERVAWSPDGGHAAVLGDDGLRLCTPDGTLSPLLIPDVERVSWFPDSKRIAVIREMQLTSWKQIETAFPDDAKNTVSRAPSVLRDVLAYHGNWGNHDLQDSIAAHNQLGAMDTDFALLYLREHHAEELKAGLGNNWPKFADMVLSCVGAQVYDVSDGRSAKEGTLMDVGDGLGEGRTLLELRVSPSGKAVALIRGNYDSRLAVLVITNPDKSQEPLWLGKSSCFPDWSPDGSSIVYMRSESADAKDKDQVQFTTLSRQKVLDDKGELVADVKRLPAREDLVGTFYDYGSRVRVTSDGRIFFSSLELTLPAAAKDIPTHPGLFFIQPDKQSVVTRVIPHSIEASAALGDMVDFFEVSPDGTHISIPFDDGRVSLLEVAGGTVIAVQTLPTLPTQELCSIPTWRSATELYFVQPTPSASQQFQVVRYSTKTGTAVSISDNWPKSVTDRWLTDVKPSETAPTTSTKQRP